MDRRRWGKMAAIGASVASLSGIGWLVLRAYLPWITRGPDGRWRLGPRVLFPAGSATLLRRADAVIIHDADGLHALSAICTHERCQVRAFPERKELICPCHGTAFNYRGEVKHGPAPRSLPWLALAVEGDELVLDGDKEVPPG